MLKGKITPALCVNLDDYEAKLDKLNNLVKKMSVINWTAETAIQFCKDQGMQVEAFQIPQFANLQTLYDDLNTFSYKSIEDKVAICKRQLEALKIDKFDSYNGPYKNHINNILSDKNKHLDDFFGISIGSKRSDNYLKSIIAKLSQLVNLLDPDISDLFEHFKYGNKNYVIFGKNGAGKTTLLKHISESMFKNAIVVPANRIAMQSSTGYVGLHTNYTLNQMLDDKTSLMYLTREINNRTLDSYENGTNKNTVLRTRFYDIFSALGLDRDIVAVNESLFLKGNQIDKYSVDYASDGEKSIAYLIMAVLLAPEDSFVFIDEPERHLNGALMRNLFDKLEIERSDLRFVYLTHNIDFVESRKNVELITLKNLKYIKNGSSKKLKIILILAWMLF